MKKIVKGYGIMKHGRLYAATPSLKEAKRLIMFRPDIATIVPVTISLPSTKKKSTKK